MAAREGCGMLRPPLLFRIWSLVPPLLPATAGLFVLALIVNELRRDVVEVMPIGVPARLAEAGLTPEVVALRLLDGVSRVENTVRGEPQRRAGAEVAGSQPDFTVPIAGISLRSVAQVIRNLFGIAESRVSGEVTVDGDALRIRLRLTGEGVIADEYAADPYALIDRAAPFIVKATQSTLYAWWLAETAPSESAVQGSLRSMLAEPEMTTMESRTLRLLLSRTLIRTGRAAEALEITTALLAEQPLYPNALFGRARALRELGRLDEAMAEMRRVQGLLPTAAFIHVGIAQILRDRGDPQAALAELAPALPPGRADSQAPTEAALTLLALGRDAEALAHAQRAVAQDGKNPSALTALGAALLRLGRAEEALVQLDRALAEAPMWQEGRLWRIDALLALGRMPEARLELEEHAEGLAAVPRLAAPVAALRARLAG